MPHRDPKDPRGTGWEEHQPMYDSDSPKGKVKGILGPHGGPNAMTGIEGMEGTPGGMPPAAPPPGLDPSMMQALQEMMMGAPGTPPGQLGAMNPFRYLGNAAYKGEGVNPMTGMPMLGGPMAQFQQGPQQPLPPQTGMPLPQ